MSFSTSPGLLDKLTKHPSLKGYGPFSSNDFDRDETSQNGASLTNFSSSTGKWIKELSSMANVVVGRCARVVMLTPDELKSHFEEEAPETAKEPSKYARNLLEYCCFRALAVATQMSDHLKDKDFRRWTFDMMLAWEAPGAAHQPGALDRNKSSGGLLKGSKWQMKGFKLVPKVDVESSAGLDAFARLAPAIAVVADSVTVHNQFEILTAGIGGRLPFNVYNKFLIELDRTIKGIKAQSTGALISALGVSKGEEGIVETDGTATQPILQHIGVTAWPGRLTLTDHALYFEPSGVVSYDSPKKFDLSADLRHVVKPDLTGPWGARLFDKAVAYKSFAISEPIVLEFPELTGHMRRDFWLAIIREIIALHSFIRSYRLEGSAKKQAIAKAVLGIARLKAIWTLHRALPSHPDSLLTFVTADELPGGDKVLKAVAAALRAGDWGSPNAGSEGVSEASRKPSLGERLLAVSPPGINQVASSASTSGSDGLNMPVGEVLVGEMTALERAILQSRDSSKKLEKAKATVDEVKVEGIGTNLALMKELCLPLVALGKGVQSLASWDEPARTIAFLAICFYILYRDWLGYLVPTFLILNAVFILWMRYARQFDRAPLRPQARRNEVLVETPPQQSPVEQLMVLQKALAQVEAGIQGVNIALLKARALLLSEAPQASDELLAVQVVVAILLAILPLRVVISLALLDTFTRQLDVRRESTERLVRRCREWWHRIPVVPVRFVEKEALALKAD